MNADSQAIAAMSATTVSREYGSGGGEIAAHRPGELHVYAQGSHGFGMRKQGLPTDHWIDRFGEWLQVQGFMPARQPLK